MSLTAQNLHHETWDVIMHVYYKRSTGIIMEGILPDLSIDDNDGIREYSEKMSQNVDERYQTEFEEISKLNEIIEELEKKIENQRKCIEREELRTRRLDRIFKEIMKNGNQIQNPVEYMCKICKNQPELIPAILALFGTLKKVENG